MKVYWLDLEQVEELSAYLGKNVTAWELSRWTRNRHNHSNDIKAFIELADEQVNTLDEFMHYVNSTATDQYFYLHVPDADNVVVEVPVGTTIINGKNIVQ